MESLLLLHPPKLLRFIYYSLYTYALATNNSTPKLSSSITMAFTHGVQFLFFIDLLNLGFDVDLWGYFFDGIGRWAFAIVALLFLYLVELFYSYKDKHLNYIEEFENTPIDSKKSVYLFFYIFVSLGMLIVSFWLIAK